MIKSDNKNGRFLRTKPWNYDNELKINDFAMNDMQI